MEVVKKRPGKKTSQYCCVVGCNNSYRNSKGKDIKFYSFPSKPYEKNRRQRWISAVRRVNPDGTKWMPTKNSIICSVHFVGNRRREEMNHPAYVPTLFPEVYRRTTKQTAEHQIARHNRWMQRRWASQASTSVSEIKKEIGEPAVCGKELFKQTNQQSTQTEEPSCKFGPLMLFTGMTSSGVAQTFVAHHILKDSEAQTTNTSFGTSSSYWLKFCRTR
ncbi:peroxynitrite isomerase THAP4-like [Ornithodoros turicata]|uniref:peroxynitrite isomerase THAP4-like n=1 Tax=Ornithodoros turicata TaxID=34597 RepID=UPI003139AADA